MHKHGLIEIVWDGRSRMIEVEINSEVVYDQVFFSGICEPLWCRRGTYEDNPLFTGKYARTWVDPRMFSESEEMKDAKGFQVWSDMGIFQDEEHFRNFLKDYLRAKIVYEVWDNHL